MLASTLGRRRLVSSAGIAATSAVIRGVEHERHTTSYGCEKTSVKGILDRPSGHAKYWPSRRSHGRREALAFAASDAVVSSDSDELVPQENEETK